MFEFIKTVFQHILDLFTGGKVTKQTYTSKEGPLPSPAFYLTSKNSEEKGIDVTVELTIVTRKRFGKVKFLSATELLSVALYVPRSVIYRDYPELLDSSVGRLYLQTFDNSAEVFVPIDVDGTPIEGQSIYRKADNELYLHHVHMQIVDHEIRVVKWGDDLKVDHLIFTPKFHNLFEAAVESAVVPKV